MRSELLNSSGNINSSIYVPGRLKTKHPEIYKEVMESTPEDEPEKIRIALYVNGLTEVPKCRVCNARLTNLTSKTCSRKCSNLDSVRNKAISTTLKTMEPSKRELINESVAKTSLAKYGVTNASKTSESREKISRHQRDAWARDPNRASPFNDSQVQEKAKATILERYGVTNGFCVDLERSRLKFIKTCNEKYGVDHYSQVNLKNLSDVNDKKFMKSLIESGLNSVKDHFGFGGGHSAVMHFLRSHGYEIDSRSQPESEVVAYVKTLGVDCVRSSRSVISPYELDIYIPEHKLAIEFNGIYWHSAGAKEEERPDYHLMKTEMCEAQGIHLLHIFENEWVDPQKRKIWESVIAHKLGKSKRIFARKCELKELHSKDANEFIQTNHLQGKCNGASRSIGLFHEGVLVQVAAFGKPRYSKGYDYELLRLCSLCGYSVVGGASKILNHINSNIVSYANRRWSFGNVYDQVGFKRVSVSKPCYYYINQGVLYHRSSYMKHKLESKLKRFDPSKTEVENCYANGLRRIWDCGNIVYCFSKSVIQ